MKPLQDLAHIHQDQVGPFILKTMQEQKKQVLMVQNIKQIVL